MNNLKKYFPLLKKGTSKTNIPFYANMVKFSENTVETCNSLVSTKVNFKTPIRGCTDFAIFERIVNSLSEDATIEQRENLIAIIDGNSKYGIVVDDIEFQEIVLGEKQLIELDDNILSALTIASNYTAKEDTIRSHNYIYLSNKAIVSTNITTAFYKSINIELSEPIPVSKEALALASIGDRIGIVETNGENNFILESDNATVVFSGRADVRESFPIKEIKKFKEESKDSLEKIENIVPIANAISQVSSLLINENKPVVTITVKNKLITVSAETAVAGRAEVEIETDSKVDIEFNINPSFINNVPTSYDLYIDKKEPNKRIVLQNKDSYIIIACLV